MSLRKKTEELPNPYHEQLRELSRADVDYIVIGVSGINYFAKDARQILSTADYDIYLEPTPQNIERAWRAFRKGGYSVVVREGDHLRAVHTLNKRTQFNLLLRRKTLIAVGPYNLIIEGLTAISGFGFEQLRKRAVWMRDTQLKFQFLVGDLKDLLESKRIADRPKDRLFLVRYKRLLEEG